MNLTQNFELVWPKLNSFNETTTLQDGKGEMEKVLAMVVLGLGSFISGILPAFISERNRRRFPLTTSLMLCFGAGILLATALIHILPEVRKQMNSNWAEISLCAGFFAIYFVDEFIHYFFGEAIQHSHGHDEPHSHNTTPQNTTLSNNHRHNYGSLHNSESAPLLSAQNTEANGGTQQHNNHAHLHEHGNGNNHSHEENHHEHVHCNDEIVEDANARICHTSHTEPCSQSMTGTLGLFVALSLHSAIEGLAIGVQDSSTKVLFLLGAVACHKFVMGFCLGLEFRSNPQTPMKSQIIGISVFAMGAICGIGLGMIIVDVPSSWSTTALPVIQGLAGGTLLYVTVCEVIPREKARWHLNSERRLAGFAQFLVVAIGFSAMCIINFYLDDDA
ncbi:zinc transporter ZIP1 [Calliphora vicina]|uniref:zinc transporter ZIP1 n=1 Tax=Calliphora vicina TaxID=7373 RepID=UPI00325ACAB6